MSFPVRVTDSLATTVSDVIKMPSRKQQNTKKIPKGSL